MKSNTLSIHFIKEFGPKAVVSPAAELAKAIAEIKLPRDVSGVVVNRKFIALSLKPTDETTLAPSRILLVVGPLLRQTGFQENYRHRQLLDYACELLAKEIGQGRKIEDYAVSGGKLTVSVAGDRSVEFGGSSGDYGVHDPALILHRKAIANAFGVPVYFKFNDYVKL